MILKGRRKIISSISREEIQSDIEKLKDLINTSLLIHLLNKTEIDYLLDYKNGAQTILSKTKAIRPEINNMLVINHADMITRNIVGYFLGTPIQYIQSGADKKAEIDRLNKIVSYEDKSSIDKEIGTYQSICGTAYRIIFTDGLYGDDVPFEDRCLNPSNTFVVYENRVSERPLLGVTYYPILDDKGMMVGATIYAYGHDGLYTFTTNDPNGYLDTTEEATFTPYSVGGVPIIEYPNNTWRLGDWELCIGLMDAINDLHSGRLDDIDQIVQSLLIFINADVDSTTYDEMREAGVITLKNTTTSKTEVQTITNSLDQTGMNTFAGELEQLLYAMLGIPDRNNRSGGGGDTGQAVELRDGWADLEIVARNKELTYKKSEKQSLKIMLTILNNTESTNLSLMDVDIKFSRNKNSNLLVKTQGYMNLIQTKTLDPADCLTIVDLVSDVNEFIARGKTFWGEYFAGKVPMVEEIVTDPSLVE